MKRDTARVENKKRRDKRFVELPELCESEGCACRRDRQRDTVRDKLSLSRERHSTRLGYPDTRDDSRKWRPLFNAFLCLRVSIVPAERGDDAGASRRNKTLLLRETSRFLIKELRDHERASNRLQAYSLSRARHRSVGILSILLSFRFLQFLSRCSGGSEPF